MQRLKFVENKLYMRTYVPKKWRLDRNRRKYWWVVWAVEPGRGWVYHEPGGTVRDYQEYETRKDAQVKCDELNAWWAENGRIVRMLSQSQEVVA